ncbi:MAG TPA: hypothetical protein VG602_05985 [Actinomycetota bacterium]|nr:hypothetical protein [Actinomycetota bacterium]
MSPDRRLIALLVAALAVAVPAIVLVTLCVGRACERAAPITARVPFCSLPRDVRDLLAAGFRDGRSPHVMAVTSEGATVVGSTARPEARWPSVDPARETVPLVFVPFGADGVVPELLPDVPHSVRLDAVAPTISAIIGLDRPHPGVRSGEALPLYGDPRPQAPRPRLVLLVVWKGVGSTDLKTSGAHAVNWLELNALFKGATGSGAAQAGSLPLDPTSVLTTVGTGGLPRDHGITGTLVRNDRGRVVRAFDRGSPFSVIAGLGDDLDELRRQAPRIGLVGTEPGDRGLIGRNWYLEHDRDDVVLSDRSTPSEQVGLVRRILGSGYGSDTVPDLLAVVMEGPVRELDAALGPLIEAAGDAADRSMLLVVTATGSESVSPTEVVPVASVERALQRALGEDVVEATAVGGFFLDQEALARTGITDDRVVNALREIEAPDGSSLFADVFAQVAVTFARYC